ncbi:MAG: flippase [Chitinophagaceae bacterium]
MKKYLSSYWIRSAFYTFLQRFSLTFFGLVNFMVLIRTLGDDKVKMGTWALFLTITTIFEASKSNLLKNAHIKYASASDDPEERSAVASSSLIINGLLTVLFILLIAGFSGFLNKWFSTGDDLSSMLRWFIPGLIFMVFFSHYEAVQQSNLDFKGVFAGSFVRQFLFFLIIIGHLVFEVPFTLVHLVMYQSASILAGTLVLFVTSRKYLSRVFNPSVLWMKKIGGFGGYVFGSGFMANLFANVDQLMTGAFLSTASVAYYNAASRINQLVDIPSYAASEILFPKMSRASSEEGVQKVKYLYERMVAILISFTTPAAIVIIIFPTFVIDIIAGSQYHAAAPILQLYMLAGILRPMQNQSANLLNSIGKPKLCFIINAISLGANLLINYICLLNFGFYGAAIGTLITCVLGTITWHLVMRKEVDTKLGSLFGHVSDTYRIMFSYLGNTFSKTRPVRL